MQQLTIDPPVPFIVPNTPEITIALVGCGGTGSHIAQALARLSSHCQDTNGPFVQLVFIDGDTVEQKNVGRQLFAASDIGKNKAQTLAARFSAVFGISIVAFPHMLEKVTRIANPNGYGILVGAVDGASGRRAIASQLGSYNWKAWIDCGNHESSGQIVCGTTQSKDRMHASLQLGMCVALPTAPLLYPELLKDAPVQRRADCAAAALDNAQSLMVNQMMAAICGQYLYDLVIHRRLTRFRTVVDLESLSMRSDAITARALSLACDLTADQINGTKATKQKRRAA